MGDLSGNISNIVSTAPFWVGLTTVAVFAAGRFNERRIDAEKELDPPLPVGCFTGRFRFSSARLMYILSYTLLYGILIFLFSFEFFQEYFRGVFGSLQATTDVNSTETLGAPGSETPTESETPKEFGSPAWVATFVPILISTTPWAQARDALFRRWLWTFAGVPGTAHGIANDLIRAIERKYSLNLKTEEGWLTVYDEIDKIAAKLRSDFPNYADFMHNHTEIRSSLENALSPLRKFIASDRRALQSVHTAREVIAKKLEEAKEKSESAEANATLEILATLEPILADAKTGKLEEQENAEAAEIADIESSIQPPNLIKVVRGIAVKRARLTACGILYTRRSDKSARIALNLVMRKVWGERDTTHTYLKLPPFTFSYLHALAGFAFVTLFAMIAGMIREFLTAEEDLAQEILEWLIYAPCLGAAFLLPLIPSASVRFYAIDALATGKFELDLNRYILAVAAIALASVGLSGIVLIALGVVYLRSTITDLQVIQLLIWTLPMMVSAILFFFMTQFRLTSMTGLNRIIDFVVFVLGVGLAAAISFVFWEIMQGNIQDLMHIEELFRQRGWPNVIILAIASGALGLSQCESSRTGMFTAIRHRLAANRTPGQEEPRGNEARG